MSTQIFVWPHNNLLKKPDNQPTNEKNPNPNTQTAQAEQKRSISNWIRPWSGSPSVYTNTQRREQCEDRKMQTERLLGWHWYQRNMYGTMPRGQRWSAHFSLEITEVTWEKLYEYPNMGKSFSWNWCLTRSCVSVDFLMSNNCHLWVKLCQSNVNSQIYQCMSTCCSLC